MTRIVTDLPYSVEETETCWIPMSDGCRLAARLWLPEGAADRPVPAVFEYIPYRRRDFTRSRDEPIHRYFAGHGYASLRVDMRGSGDSDGLLADEYIEQEQTDALEAIRWLSEQPWCNGSIGMFGKSWGGINCLQVAAHRPPELKSILSVCSTDDRYIDTDHYMGGSLTDVQMIWGSLYLSFLRRPPDPDVVGERWREIWMERLANEVQPMEEWFRHQRYDAFWKHGSICENFEAITCSTYLVGGWLDGYSSSVFRMLSGLHCPRKALIGPWGHQYPHDGKPAPAIGFLQECVRWWDHWLKGIDTGIMAEPMLRVWMQDSVTPDAQNRERPGRWVAEKSWPSPQTGTERYFMNSGKLGPEAEPETRLQISSPQTVGLLSNFWHGALVDHQAADQRQEDGGSLCFDSEPLDERLEILGAPTVTLELASDRPVALVAARLTDVAPGGSSLFVSFGVLNLTRRESHEEPTPLEPGRRYTITLRMDEIAHCFAPGHRIRLALSTSYWHRVWPAPENVTLGVFAGSSTLSLPVRSPRPDDEKLQPFGDPEIARPMGKTVLRPDKRSSTIRRDAATREVVSTHHQDFGVYRIEQHGLEIEDIFIDEFSIRDNDPLSAKATMQRKHVFARGDWKASVEARVELTATKERFQLTSSVDAYEGDKQIDSKSWNSSFKRDLL